MLVISALGFLSRFQSMLWNYADYEYYVSALLLICAMFGMGNTLKPIEFIRVARAPQAILLIVVLQVLLTPCLAVALSRVFSLSAGISVGLLVVAALPGGLFSNVLAHLGRGNVALSVSATAICSLACLVTTTFVLKTFGATHVPKEFAMPVQHILSEIGFCLLLPLFLGMCFLRLCPDRSPAVTRFCVRASTVLLALVIIGAVSAGRIDPMALDWRSPAAVVLLQILMVWLCYALGLLCRMSLDDCFTVAMEVVVRNAHLGILLKSSLFPAGEANELGDGVLFVVLLYGATSLIVGGVEVLIHRKRTAWRALRYGTVKENSIS